MDDARTLSTKTIFALRDHDAAVTDAAELLRRGGIVVIPTETVYGLAANALNPQAVSDVFRAKGRPNDNPLIVHIANMDMLPRVAAEVNGTAKKLMDAFWPGPLTLVLKKNPDIPDEVTAGLPTVGVRMPGHALARDIIAAAGVPIAAPSANASGRPSPTLAMHAFEDLGGRVPLIIDGGPCDTGVESTVVDATGNCPKILRPGAVTAEMIREVAGDVGMCGTGESDIPPSPGMKYRHYAPRARVCVYSGNKKEVAETINSRYDIDREKSDKPLILCTTADAALYAGKEVRPLGDSMADVQRSLFGALRNADADGYSVILFHYTSSMGLAVKNRIWKAAGKSQPAREDKNHK